MSSQAVEVDQWRRLETYRQRYAIEDRLGPLVDLEKSMRRRRLRSAALSRRLEELEKMLREVRTELRAVEHEIAGSRETGALLIEEILDQIQVETGEAWSPTPVRGFRVWQIEDNKVMGSRVHWPSPKLVSECLRQVSGEDLPHTAARCGPPACGIYAVKHLEMFGDELPRGIVDRSVVGVAALTGKVVEHEAGYRATSATVIAAVARYDTLALVTDDPAEIAALFDDPLGALARSGQRSDSQDTREFLVRAQSKEEQWI